MTRFCGSSRKVRSHCWSLRSLTRRDCQSMKLFQKHVLKLGGSLKTAWPRRRAIHLHPPSCQAGPSERGFRQFSRGFRVTDQGVEDSPSNPNKAQSTLTSMVGKFWVRVEDSGLGVNTLTWPSPVNLWFTFGKLRSVETFATVLTEDHEENCGVDLWRR